MFLAKETLKLINEAIEKDQGATYRGYLGQFIPMMGDAYSTKQNDYRGHLGASVIGKKCARQIWYDFRWTSKGSLDRKTILLFNRGHLEEARFLAMLSAAGLKVWFQDQNGDQFRIQDCFGHFGGSLDGVVKGVPEFPELPLLTEFKTFGDSPFKRLIKSGVKIEKPEHYTQMQIYMRKQELPGALYCAVNKNTDELHLEIVEAEPEYAEQYLDRAGKIIFAEAPPPRLQFAAPSLYDCRFCAHKNVCHFDKKPDKTCRSCYHVVIGDNGSWKCKLKDLLLTKEQQLEGCEEYVVKDEYHA